MWWKGRDNGDPRAPDPGTKSEISGRVLILPFLEQTASEGIRTLTDRGEGESPRRPQRGWGAAEIETGGS